MKLTKDFLAIEYEQGTRLKSYYLEQQEKTLANNRNGHGEIYYNMGMYFAESISRKTNPKNIYYISKNVQEYADLIKFDKINLDWFSNIKSTVATYILSKEEFYRFEVIEGVRINCVRWFSKKVENGFIDIKYESFGIKFDTKEITPYPNQDEEAKKRFVKLLLFIELTDPELLLIKPKQKIKKDIGLQGKDNKIYNDTPIDVTLVNTHWNKIVVTGAFKVQGHLRLQPYPSLGKYKIIYIEPYQKQGYTKFNQHKQNE